MAIDIGCTAEGRGSLWSGPVTMINKGNPANATGTIDEIKIYPSSSCGGWYVAIFYATNGNTLKSRSQAGPFVLTKDEVNTLTAPTHFTALAVQAGDYIGLMIPDGYYMDYDNSGGDGVWRADGDGTPVDTEMEYTLGEGWIASIEGSGLAAGWTGKIMGITNPAKVLGIEVANIAKVMGVE